MNDTNEIISLSLQHLSTPRLQVAPEQPSEEEDHMVNLVFMGIAGADPEIRTTESGTLASFPIDVKQQPHLPPTRLVVVALGKQGVYAQQLIKKESLVMVSGWFCIGQHRNGNEFVVVKAKQLRSLVPSLGL